MNYLTDLQRVLPIRLDAIRKSCQLYSDHSVAGTFTGQHAVKLHGDVIAWADFRNKVVASGVPAAFESYLREIVAPPDPTLDVLGPLSTLHAAVVAVRDWLVNPANLERDGNDFLSTRKPTETGFDDVTYTAGQTAALKALLDAVVSARDAITFA